MFHFLFYSLILVCLMGQGSYAAQSTTQNNVSQIGPDLGPQQRAYFLNLLGEGCHFGKDPSGQKTEVNFEKARQYYLQAVELGSAPAANHLGRLYTLGEGVPKDRTEALKWYRKSAELDPSLENKCLNGLLQPDFVLCGIVDAAEQGNPAAQATLGEIYAHGYKDFVTPGYKDFIVPDLQKAVYFYEKAASQGDQRAIYELTRIYRYDSPLKNEEKAVFWEKKLKKTP